ncbi:hypothetical protein JCM8097_008046 [Rhodosporidiobolus ruineniae]
MKAILVSAEGRELVDIPVPQPQENEILVKNVAAGSNPRDWKIPLVIDNYSAIEGRDLAGYVEAVGPGVNKFKKGDKVGGFTKMHVNSRYGTYAEYSICPTNTAFLLGPKTSFEDAAALPLAYITAAIGSFVNLGLPTPDRPAQDDHPAVLVWGGATSVGVYVIQLLKKANLRVVAVAGSSTSVPTSYGADSVLDYRGKSHGELVDTVTSAAGGSIRYAFDCVSENGTLEVIAEALGCLSAQDGKGKATPKVTYILPASDEQMQLYKKHGVGFQRTMCAVAYGDDLWGDESIFAEHWFDRLGEWLERGEFKAQKVTVVPGGLAGVAEGLRRLKEGEVRGEKLVYRIAETPGLEQ